MRKLTLSLGFDDERPYGPLAQQEAGRAFLAKKVDFIGKMNDRFNKNGVPRTHFLLASYLESARSNIGEAVLRGMYPKANPLLDLQQHSYSHGIMEPLQGVNRPVMTSNEYIDDIAKASVLMEDILAVQPEGLRTPYGYEKDLSHRTDILSGLHRVGIRYVSSDLGMKNTLEGAMTEKRQPHTYEQMGFPDIVEVPAHGLQDVVYTKEKAKQLFGKEEAPSAKEAFAHYDSVLEVAKTIGAERVSVALCLHPWAVMEYDPELKLLLKIVESARTKGFDVRSYRQVADAMR